MFTVTKRSDWSFDTSGGVSMSAGPGTALERLLRERKRKAPRRSHPRPAGPERPQAPCGPAARGLISRGIDYATGMHALFSSTAASLSRDSKIPVLGHGTMRAFQQEFSWLQSGSRAPGASIRLEAVRSQSRSGDL